jgi:hypothetical protein
MRSHTKPASTDSKSTAAFATQCLQLDSVWALAKVANDLRYMWEAIIDPEAHGAWSTWSR